MAGILGSRQPQRPTLCLFPSRAVSRCVASGSSAWVQLFIAGGEAAIDIKAVVDSWVAGSAPGGQPPVAEARNLRVTCVRSLDSFTTLPGKRLVGVCRAVVMRGKSKGSCSMSLGARLRRALFGISADEAEFRRRGFVESNDDCQARLETAGRTFIEGYNTALSDQSAESLAQGIDRQI